MSTEQSLIEKAISFIGKQGSARTPEIAAHLGIKEAHVSASLARPVELHYLVTCKVTMPGRREMNEYRIAEAVSTSKQSWGDFKISRRAATTPVKPLTAPKEPPPRTPCEKKIEAPAAPKKAARMENGRTVRVPADSTPKLHEIAPRIVFMIDSTGRLRIELDGKTHICSNAETRDAGLLMIASEPVWS